MVALVCGILSRSRVAIHKMQLRTRMVIRRVAHRDLDELILSPWLLLLVRLLLGGISGMLDGPR